MINNIEQRKCFSHFDYKKTWYLGYWVTLRILVVLNGDGQFM